MKEDTKPVVVFSRCLGFAACRYDASTVVAPAVEELKAYVEARPVCPELEIGLGLPRDPIRLVSSGRGLRLVQPSTGRDLTLTMQRFAASFLEGQGDVDGFILKAKSPSCGLKDSKVYAGEEETEPRSRSSGLFAAEIVRRSPALPVTSDARLGRPLLRSHFLTGLFATARFRSVRASGKPAELLRFHMENKLLLLAFREEDERAMGRLVASARGRPFPEVVDEYGMRLGQALSRPTGRGGHTNVLEHAPGFFSEKLSGEEKQAFLQELGAYRQRTGDLEPCLETLRDWIARFEEPYLSRQSYFAPFPSALARKGRLDTSSRRGSSSSP